ncbi:carboxynorspermidine decarboxylase [Haliangium sp.]|uniref:carboxynorspermidine decarboxylase n=1 Tax=Haliangium sp. TaxID=2663208 RepID=UPI003D0F17E6
MNIDTSGVDTPCYICDLGALRRNLEILAGVQERAGCKILLALKGFAMWSVFPVVREYLAGVATSSVAEARLGRDKFCAPADPGGRTWEVHAYAPAYSEADVAELVELADHIVFNSVSQWRRHGPVVRAAGERQGRAIECGLRLNPRHREVEVELYDPCARFSRLGVPYQTMPGPDDPALAGLDGLHFHTLCELGSDALERTVAAVEDRFGPHLERVKWVNFGGGHHITRPNYDVDLLVELVRRFRDRHGVEVYLEPGEAIALNTGVLVASVLDIVDNEMPIAILDTSATAHMPDVLEMPYRPDIVGAGAPGAHAHTYRLGGLTCLAGDVIGDYSFPAPLAIGQKLVFDDMAHYTMVKNTTFNGVRLPSIATHDPDTGEIRVVRRFGYEDYMTRLS